MVSGAKIFVSCADEEAAAGARNREHLPRARASTLGPERYVRSQNNSDGTKEHHGGARVEDHQQW